MKNNLLVCCELEKHIDDFICFIYIEYGINQMLEISKLVPMNIAIIKVV